MPTPFAKVFDFPGGYQLLVQREDCEDDDGRYQCSSVIKSDDGVTMRIAGIYESEANRDERFAEITQEEAHNMALGMLRVMDNTFQFPA